jgi:hypothetical protein
MSLSSSGIIGLARASISAVPSRSQPILIPHFLFDRLALGGVEAAATFGRAERK